MALDFVARAMAASAKSDAATALGKAGSVDVFSHLPLRTIDASTTSFATGGYSAMGQGAALYVADTVASAALAAAHPRFCKADAAGRYFRLTGDHVAVEQGGATGVAGTNDQPAIQAALDYAVAVGIPTVRLLPTHESWQPPFPGGTPSPWRGCHLRITGDVALIGAVQGTTITLKNNTGGTRSKTDGTGTWWSGWLIYDGAGVTKSILRGVKVDGGTTFSNVWSNAESNVADKGVALWDGTAPNLVTIDHRDVTLCNFAGEIWYNGGSFANLQIYVENLTLYGSPQSAFNPGSLAKMTAVNVQARTAYLAVEAISGKGHTYIGGKFSDWGGGGCSMIGTALVDSAYPYYYPFRDTTVAPPWTVFEGTRFEASGHGGVVTISPWMRGRIVTVDCSVSMNHGCGDLRDVDLDIESWADQASGFEAVSFSGPPNLTTQLPGAPVGTYYAKPHNISLRINCCRTALAQTNSRTHATGVRLYGGLIDQNSVRLSVRGAAKTPFEVISPVSGFALPLITTRDFQTLQQLDGGAFADFNDGSGNLLASKALDILWPALQIEPANVGVCNVTINTAYAYATGQRVRLIHNHNSTNRVVAFARDGAGMRLNANRSLRRRGEYLELEWRAEDGVWIEVGYNGDRTPYTLTDAATITPNLSAATDFEITLAGSRTLANPTNATPGQRGTIRIVQDPTGSRTLTYGTNWCFPGGAAAGGLLSTAANAVDVINYVTGSNGLIYARLDKALAA